MERISIEKRTSKTKGNIFLRFRVRDGRAVQLYYKSDIKAPLADLDRFTDEGTLKKGYSIYNAELADEISRIILAIKECYGKMVSDNLTLDSATLTSLVEEKLHPRVESKVERDSLLRRFEKFKEAAFRDGIIGTDRHKHYGTVYGKLYRFLYINKKLSIRPVAMTADLLMDFRSFLYDEYQFVERYPKLYEDFDKRELPTKRRSRNTVVTEMKMVQAFFRELEDMEEIEKSPFRRLGKERKKIVMTSKYNDPVYLYKEEFLTILHADVPHYLEETRAAFVLQCAFGFRISDFKKLSLDNVRVSPDGIPYIHYLPQKTKEMQKDYCEIETPIVRFALDIIKRSGFNFPVLRNQTGRTGYNAKIKSLLQSCHIDRKVNIFNEKTLENEYVPIYSIAGSKLCRSTFVDMMNKVQVNQYAAGLHKEGSDAINHYTKLELKDRFILMCQAFDEKPYSVKKDLSIFANKNA